MTKNLQQFIALQAIRRAAEENKPRFASKPSKTPATSPNSLK